MDYLNKYLEFYEESLDVIPSIYYLWKKSQPYVNKNDEYMVKKIENLIFILHNSVVSPKIRMGSNIKFAYGGIGTVVHKDTVIDDGVAIGQNVTIGGTPGKFRVDENGKRHYVPHIKKNVYVAAGCRVLGGVVLKDFSIIGANSVLLEDSEAFSIYSGMPAKKIKKVTKNNCLKYRSMYHNLKGLNVDEYISLFPVE